MNIVLQKQRNLFPAEIFAYAPSVRDTAKSRLMRRLYDIVYIRKPKVHIRAAGPQAAGYEQQTQQPLNRERAEARQHPQDHGGQPEQAERGQHKAAQRDAKNRRRETPGDSRDQDHQIVRTRQYETAGGLYRPR